MLRIGLPLVILAALWANLASSQVVFVEKLPVKQETTLDWQYAAQLQSDVEAASERRDKYASRRQRYDFFGPVRSPARELPLILFVSPGNVPVEWKNFEPTCRRHGILFAGARNVGNAQDFFIRIRASLDVLDDVRRRYRVDPDRTYIAGFSGGAVIASRIAFSLPECFGGLFCMGQRVVLPRTEALIERAAERVSVAAICGSNELVSPDVEFIDQTVARAFGFRCRAFVIRGLGHRMPKSNAIEVAFRWLESSVEKRRAAAEKNPTTRLPAKTAFNAEAWRATLLQDAKRLWQDQQFVAAVSQLKWIAARWPESTEAHEAMESLAQFTEGPEFVEAHRKFTSERQSAVDAAYIIGNERLAGDRRSWFTSKHRAGYATKALRRIQQTHGDQEEWSERVSKLEKIVKRAD